MHNVSASFRGGRHRHGFQSLQAVREGVVLTSKLLVLLCLFMYSSRFVFFFYVHHCS